MNIDDLCISKNAQFYKLKKNLSKIAVRKAFRNISESKIGKYLFNDVRKPYTTVSGNAVVYSLVAYKMQAEPSFLSGSDITEDKYAYLLLLECDDALVILKKYVDSPEKLFEKFIEEYDYDKFCHFYGSQHPEYERVAMKNMSISNAVIRSRSLEAKSLNGIIPSASSSRSIPTNFRMKIGSEVYTLTPSTSRVSHRDKKSPLEELIDWAFETKNELNVTTNTSEFLNNFASPICLQDIIKSGKSIVGLFLDVSEIEEKVSDGNAVLKNSDGNTLTSDEMKGLFNKLRVPIRIKDNQADYRWIKIPLSISCAKTVITLRSSLLSSIFVEEPGNEYALSSYLNKEKTFSAVFDTPTYSYYSRSCFEDKSLMESIDYILNVFDDSFNFNNVVSEKEKPHANSLTRFPATSLFRAVEDEYCQSYDITICDDMNDEWADHIAIKNSGGVSEITFIHSKFVQKDTYGASAFHEVVAQALKNIGRTQADKKHFKIKYNNEWNQCYESTQIPRVVGASNWSDLESALDGLNRNPNAIKKIVLATPFLKKSKLVSELNKIKDPNYKCKPHYVQLIWLINTFVSSCREYGVQAHILCKP
ncbi:hypothetical protein M2H12_20540 [Vibrio vulnificus]|nr:hypothetical protein [Vibrio vulnificus]MCU8172849.1 hypothetical protein [Vibrio vulnificus]